MRRFLVFLLCIFFGSSFAFAQRQDVEQLRVYSGANAVTVDYDWLTDRTTTETALAARLTDVETTQTAFAASITANATAINNLSSSQLDSPDGLTTGVVSVDNSGTTTISGLLIGSGAASFPTLDTGQGANELYAMNQNVRTTDSPTFAGLLISFGDYLRLGTGYVAYTNLTTVPRLYLGTANSVDWLLGAAAQVWQVKDASSNVMLSATSGASVVVNEAGLSTTDFRAEGDTNPNLLFVDAGNDRVGIGTNAPDSLFTITSDGGPAYFNSNSYRDSNFGGGIEVRHARGSEASPSILSSGDYMSSLYFKGHDGSAFRIGAAIHATVDATPGTSDMPGRLEFQTTPDGSAAALTRMAIYNDGGITMPYLATGTGNTVYIDTSTNELYDGSSSAETKENITEIDDTLTTVLASIEPKTYTRKGNGLREYYYIAEEVAAVMPEAVNWRWEPTTASLATTSTVPLVARTDGVPEYVAQHWERSLPRATVETSTGTLELDYYDTEITGWMKRPAGVNDRVVLSLLHKAHKRVNDQLQQARTVIQNQNQEINTLKQHGIKVRNNQRILDNFLANDPSVPAGLRAAWAAAKTGGGWEE